MSAVTLFIPGKPFAKQRARVTKFGSYTPKETVSFERVVGQLAALHFKAPLTGPLRLTVQAVFKPPASWSAKKRAAAIGRYHTQKPDLDNIYKAVSDGLNRIAFADDSQVASFGNSCKTWGESEGTKITVSELLVD